MRPHGSASDTPLRETCETVALPSPTKDRAFDADIRTVQGLVGTCAILQEMRNL